MQRRGFCDLLRRKKFEAQKTQKEARKTKDDFEDKSEKWYDEINLQIGIVKIWISPEQPLELILY